MVLPALALLLAVLVIVVAVGRWRVPAFVMLTGAALALGLGTGMSLNAVGTAFGQGFAGTMETVGLLVVAGLLVGNLLGPMMLPQPVTIVAGVLGGLGGSATAGLALLQPLGSGLPRRTTVLALTMLVTHAMVIPSPLATASASVVGADFEWMLRIAVPAAVTGLAFGLVVAWPALPGDKKLRPADLGLVALAIPVSLLIVQALAQIPSEPLGRGAARDFYTAAARPLVLAVLAVGLALILARSRRVDGLAQTSWALPLLTVGTAGGLARVLDTMGVAELIAEQVLDPRLGLLAPFFAAAIVKTLQGSSMTAVLTASGMVEPLLPAMGLDDAHGRALAAAAVGAGSIAICHVNDPLFWIATHMAGMTPGRALRTLALGSAVAAGLTLLLVIAQSVLRA